MVALKEFKKLMIDLSILTGKTPTAYGKAPKSDKQLDYMVEVYHRELRCHEYEDIKEAFQDGRLRQEIVDGFGLNVNVIEKYIVIHRNRRTNSQKEEVGKKGEFKQDMPRECVEALAEIGIDVSKLSSDKAITQG